MGNDRPLPAPTGWNPELAETLNHLVYTGVLDLHQLEAELQKLGAEYQDTVYSELIHLLTHLRFEPAEAKQHWQNLLEHHESMRQRLGSPVDLRVAIVSYFVAVARELENPTVIELRLLEQTEALAYWDELTGLRNFRFFSECLVQEIIRCDKFRTPLSLVMIDVDHFKSYNDQYGHAAGNETLAQIGRLIDEAGRQVDVAARYGGEEFAMIAPSTEKTGAQLVAERARLAVEEHFANAESEAGRLTISLGIATYPADAGDDTELIRCADRALYMAKSAGRNRVQLFGHSRRSYRRIEATLNGSFFEISPEAHHFTTVDLGDGGLRFRTDRELEVGTLLDARLSVPGAGHEIALVGRVVQVTASSKEGETEAAINIVDMGSADHKLLTDFLRLLG